METIDNHTVVEQYINLLQNVDKLIKNTGLRTEFLAKKLELPLSTFYLKKKKREFSPIEMQKIVKFANQNN